MTHGALRADGSCREVPCWTQLLISRRHSGGRRGSAKRSPNGAPRGRRGQCSSRSSRWGHRMAPSRSPLNSPRSLCSSQFWGGGRHPLFGVKNERFCLEASVKPNLAQGVRNPTPLSRGGRLLPGGHAISVFPDDGSRFPRQALAAPTSRSDPGVVVTRCPRVISVHRYWSLLVP
jgi:hypothetical protein